MKSARLIPIRAELIVFRAFLGIAQDLVGLVDLLEFLLGRRFFLRLGQVGMVFARELAKSALDLIGAGRFRDAERLVIIPELNRHNGAEEFPASPRLRNRGRELEPGICGQ